MMIFTDKFKWMTFTDLNWPYPHYCYQEWRKPHNISHGGLTNLQCELS